MHKYLYGAAIMGAVLASANAAEESPLYANALQALARASSTSEVLTLNITNLIILGIIKAIIIGIGVFFGSQNNARSSDATTVSITNADLNGGLCFMMYTSGAYEKLDCIKRSACEDPKTAKDYLQGAKMWMKLHQMMKVVPFEERYYDIMTQVQEAVEHSAKGGDCQVFPW